MPGINTVITFNRPIDGKQVAIKNSLEKMNYFPDYYSELLFKNDNMLMSFSGYKQYPHAKATFDHWVILIDGAIYNKTTKQVVEELTEIIPAYLKTQDDGRLQQFILGTDGEYLIYIIDPISLDIILINDSLGRLPLFIYKDQEQVILSRAIKYITSIIPYVEIDREALPGYFTFLAPLGSRTLLKGIDRIAPATLIRINIRKSEFKTRALMDHNFDERLDDHDIDYYTNILHDSFLTATANRSAYFKDRKQLLALSGGLDSRAVLMALLKCGADFENITFKYKQDLSNRDLPVVRELAKIYNLTQHTFDLPDNDIGYLEKLIMLKDGLGLNGIMGFVLQSLEIVQNNFGKDIVYYTGDGGGYIVGPRYAQKTLNSMGEFLPELITRNSLLSIEEICNTLGLDSKTYFEKMAGHFESYPERDFVHKYDRFLYYEHLLRFSMEGEDRVRHYFWLTTPLYSNEFTNYAFKLKNKYLAGWKIYREFLRLLDRECIKVKYANWGLALDSPLLPIYLQIRGLAMRNMVFKNKIIKMLRLIKNPGSLKEKAATDKFVMELRKYLGNLTDTVDTAKLPIDTKYIKSLVKNEKSSFRLYIFINLIKFVESIDNTHRN